MCWVSHVNKGTRIPHLGSYCNFCQGKITQEYKSYAAGQSKTPNSSIAKPLSAITPERECALALLSKLVPLH